MQTRRRFAAWVATGLAGFGGGLGGCGGHDDSEAKLGAPAKGGLDVRGAALFVALGKTGEVAVVDLDGWRVAVHQIDIAGRNVARSLDLGGAPNGIVYRPAL